MNLGPCKPLFYFFPFNNYLQALTLICLIFLNSCQIYCFIFTYTIMLYISFYFYLCISYISLYLKPIYVVVYTFNSLLLTALSSFYLSISLVIDIWCLQFLSIKIDALLAILIQVLLRAFCELLGHLSLQWDSWVLGNMYAYFY